MNSCCAQVLLGKRGWSWLQAAAVGPPSCVHSCSQFLGGSAFGHLWNHPQGRFSLGGYGSDGDGIQTGCVLAACQGLGLVWSECSLLHLLLWDAGHLAGPLLTMWASRSFPNTKSGILGGCACIWSVQLKPFSLPEFARGRVVTPGRQQHIPRAGGGRPGAAEAPGQAQTTLSDQPAPRLDSDPWRYRRAPVPSCPWGHPSSLSAAPGRAAGACWEQGPAAPGSSGRRRSSRLPQGGNRRCRAHTTTQHYRLGTAGRAHTWHS